ncbi:hypothetical protein [Sediminibacterium ginsengisoli]|uniref:Uncharacterized protein n=1 Tax=Sediminibacterium ginsengisoli TaxID=413434 RepID=A0A1T4RCA3_9BACT|nr:hypothetical protein [Sediminibacterium ginsengisoli]SKA13583.1 hypothetical protein SAMN04488132_111114 [Sediminibacterium ginsengisoli]
MKIKNEDVQRLAEIRRDFAEPPHLLRLESYATQRIEEVLQTLRSYTFAHKLATELEIFIPLIREDASNQRAIRQHMIDFSKALSVIWQYKDRY